MGSRVVYRIQRPALFGNQPRFLNEYDGPLISDHHDIGRVRTLPFPSVCPSAVEINAGRWVGGKKGPNPNQWLTILRRSLIGVCLSPACTRPRLIAINSASPAAPSALLAFIFEVRLSLPASI